MLNKRGQVERQDDSNDHTKELRLLCYNLAHARYLMSSELPNTKLREKYMQAWSHILYLIETSK
jgi:hypothetical protein